jgi:hypothetical protein
MTADQLVVADGECPHPDGRLVGVVVLDRSGGENHRVDVTCVRCETAWNMDSIPMAVLEAVIARWLSGRAHRLVSTRVGLAAVDGP